MIRKNSAAFFALLFLVSTINAKPWYRDWKSWAVVGASLGSSLAATHWSHDCRIKFGPSPCDGGYGAYSAREGVRFGGAVALAGISLWGRHEHFKEWAVPALGYAGYNASVALRQSRIGCPVGEHFLYRTKFTCVANQPLW